MAELGAEEQQRIHRERRAFSWLVEQVKELGGPDADFRLDEAAQARARQQLMSSLRERFDAERPGEPLLLDLYERAFLSDDEAAHQELAAHLGVCPWADARADSAVPHAETVMAVDSGAGVVKLAVGLSPPAEAFAAIAEYLCEAGCSRVEHRSGPVSP